MVIMTQEMKAMMLAVKPGDMVFVDADAVDIASLEQYAAGCPEMVKCVIIPVYVGSGKSIRDHVAFFSKETQSDSGSEDGRAAGNTSAEGSGVPQQD